eukprot:CAMPEP_0171851664 /NCGR_PEP_ID=MMETSP0992-20121227/21152_1 /TAXON_ID=483369 /ORGANISM="non described non described, Strain CCMP2098" /LENGTH=45 /DNA_ID= /DNA_START= /DNA_END= /DNA_ORIENTATION=
MTIPANGNTRTQLAPLPAQSPLNPSDDTIRRSSPKTPAAKPPTCA